MARARLKVGDIALILSGAGIAALCLTGQISSVLTPTLMRYPVALYCFTSGGTFLLLLASIVALLATLRYRRRQLYPVCLLYIGLAAFTQLNIWGEVFQLGIAGLTVGGGLLLLGCRRLLFANRTL